METLRNQSTQTSLAYEEPRMARMGDKGSAQKYVVGSIGYFRGSDPCSPIRVIRGYNVLIGANVVYKIKRMLNEEPTSFPEWVVPMAATLTQERFIGPEWIFERKLDGIRMLAFKNGNDVKLYSRNRLLQHYPAVVEAISRLPVREVILDCGVDWGSGVSIGYLLVYIS